MTNPPALDTSNIALFAYYCHSQGITLGDTITAFQTYTQYENYIDGTVRVWSSHNIGASSPYQGTDGEHPDWPTYYYSEHGDSYHDVKVRVRADGWVLAWTERGDKRGHDVIWWSDGSTIPRDLPSPTEYSTRPGRAIYLILKAAGIEADFSYTDVKYYDYEYTDARRLYIFGKKATQYYQPPQTPDEDYYYVTVPDSVTVKKAVMVWISRIAHDGVGSAHIHQEGYFDDTEIYNYDVSQNRSYCRIAGSREANHPNEYDLTSFLTTGTQHSILLKSYRSAGTVSDMRCRHMSAIVMWTT